MADEHKEISTPFMEVVTQTIQKQEGHIAEMQKTIKLLPNASKEWEGINKQLTEIKVAIIANTFPAKQLQDLSGRLTESITLLRQRVESKVVHHHQVNWNMAVSAGLFLTLCLVCCCWYSTSRKFDQYQENDLKYRFLKLTNNTGLQMILSATDSLYQFQPAFNDEVKRGEDSVRKLIERLMERNQQEVNN